MSAATEELLARHAAMQARRQSLVAELKALDTDSSAIMYVIALLDPSLAATPRPATNRVRRPKQANMPDAYSHFEAGKTTPAMLEVLRDATAPMNVGSITRAMLTAKGIDPETVSLARLSRRNSTNLQKLALRGRLRKHEDFDGMRWEIAR